jgi:RNA polymerase sigma-70 factor (ECF subfamily)
MSVSQESGNSGAHADEEHDGYDISDDRYWVARVRAGDRAAFDELYGRYFPRVYGFVDRRLRHAQDTEETVQEVFAAAFSSIHTYRGDAPFGAWLFGLARRVIAGRFRRSERPMVSLDGAEPDSADLPTSAHSLAPGPDEAYEFGERIRKMQAVVEDDLSQLQWEIFSLHHLGRLSIRDLAVRFEKSEQAVKSHLYRVRKALLAQ